MLVYVKADTYLSISENARKLGANYFLVSRILKEYKMHHNHVVLHQALKHTDFDRRVDRCNWLLEMLH